MFLTVPETADKLKVSKSCVYQLVETGQLSCHRIGTGRGAIRISETDLQEYLTSCRFEVVSHNPSPKRVRLKDLKL